VDVEASFPAYGQSAELVQQGEGLFYPRPRIRPSPAISRALITAAGAVGAAGSSR
jgi:hypothetical protein